MFTAYKYGFPHHELVDDIYANVRTYVPGDDKVGFVYRSNSDYSNLVKYILNKINHGGVNYEK